MNPTFGRNYRPQDVVLNRPLLQLYLQLVGSDYSTVIYLCQSFPSLIFSHFRKAV
jgi:hypothetical protein